jgi:acetoacetate decarboxylase
MTRDEILAAASMPLASPSYPKGPYRFVDRCNSKISAGAIGA